MIGLAYRRVDPDHGLPRYCHVAGTGAKIVQIEILSPYQQAHVTSCHVANARPRKIR